MSVRGTWPRENCTLFDKLCWLYLGDLPEKLRVRVGDDFDPSAFGWDGVQPGKAVGMAAAFEGGAAAGHDARCGAADEPVADAAADAPATDAPMTAASAQGDAPSRLRPLTFASREFWMLNAAFVANVICSYAVASFLAWNMDFFQMLMEPVIPSSIPDAFAAAMNATVWLTTMVGAVAAWRMWNRPPYHSLPRVLAISFVAFVAAELLVVDLIVYACYFGLL
ncbi:hypothetical protein [uncultured Enorma sp.]|uniref:hypothetical protein n=1 Tax=uncultured Enorma sp. TaxID=1714346 RepID=UPI00280390FD|nr:hypothetical protein [uncultured Enorma sp.]